MNHHLRFANGPSCTCAGILGALAAVLLSSCSQTGNPPAPLSKRPAPAAPNPDAVTVTTHFYTVPDGFLPAGAPGEPMGIKVVNEEEGERMVKRLQRKRSAKPVQIPSVELKPKAGASKSVKLTREHVYATEYTPAVIGKKPEDVTPGTFPVTPAIPTAFETRDLGIEATYGIHRISSSILEFDCQFNRTTFNGEMNYGKPITTTATSFFGRPVEVVLTENKIMMPIFGSDRSSTRITIPNRGYLVLHGRRGPIPKSKTSATYVPAPDLPPASTNSDWIALIQVTAPATP